MLKGIIGGTAGLLVAYSLVVLAFAVFAPHAAPEARLPAFYAALPLGQIAGLLAAHRVGRLPVRRRMA